MKHDFFSDQVIECEMNHYTIMRALIKS